MRTRYAQGRDTEYACQATLAADGWDSDRMGGSKGVADVIARCPSGSRYIQCKRYTDRPGSFTKDIGQLMSMVLPPNASAELWVKRHGVAGWIERTLIRHTYPGTMDVSDIDDLGKQERFVQPINPDQVTAFAKSISATAKEQRCRTQVQRPPKSSQQSRSRSSTTSPTTATPTAGKTEARPNAQAPATPA